MLNGKCLCGAITFTVRGDPVDTAYCHCSQCRRQSGHYWASASVLLDDISISGEVSWFAASPIARRGFCATCGSFLFWQGNDADNIGFSLGAIDGPTGITVAKHIFVADKGDYYPICDGLPQERSET
ncbi:MAG: GFA family protein [Rhodobacterales bacterium]|nr:GFA family protein [Rhodobacterales bacterium]NCT12993.1 GFA family protein [Rhodobacterales bacterium]